jgi:hypothetical protein
MNSYLLASTAFVCVFTGALAGLWLNAYLPEHHRSQASHDAIKLGTGMISVLASLVLGLLTASVKTSFDTTDAQMRSFAATLIQLDQALRVYGPETARLRDELRDYTALAIVNQWPHEHTHPTQMEDNTAGQKLDQVHLAVLQLKPGDPQQQAMRDSALKLIDSALQTRWLLIERAETSIQPVFMVILITWITLIFVSFGYNAPRNATVIVSFFICAAALAACMFLIVEMDGPFDGLIVVSSHAMRDALAHMSQ